MRIDPEAANPIQYAITPHTEELLPDADHAETAKISLLVKPKLGTPNKALMLTRDLFKGEVNLETGAITPINGPWPTNFASSFETHIQAQVKNVRLVVIAMPCRLDFGVHGYQGQVYSRTDLNSSGQSGWVRLQDEAIQLLPFGPGAAILHVAGNLATDTSVPTGDRSINVTVSTVSQLNGCVNVRFTTH